MKKQVPLEAVTLGLQNVETDIIYVATSKQWGQFVPKIKTIGNRIFVECC